MRIRSTARKERQPTALLRRCNSENRRGNEEARDGEAHRSDRRHGGGRLSKLVLVCTALRQELPKEQSRNRQGQGCPGDHHQRKWSRLDQIGRASCRERV